jgi:hypothetical protein
VAREASVAACLMLRPLWDEAVDAGDEAAIARLGDFEMRAAAAAAAAAAIDGAGFEVGSAAGSEEDRRRARCGSNGGDVDGGVVDAFGTLAEVFDAQRRDRELAGAAGDGPSFG